MYFRIDFQSNTQNRGQKAPGRKVKNIEHNNNFTKYEDQGTEKWTWQCSKIFPSVSEHKFLQKSIKQDLNFL